MTVEKMLIERLEEAKKTALNKVKFPIMIVGKNDLQEFVDICFEESKNIVNELAEGKDTNVTTNNGWIEELLEAKKNCGEDSDCSECPFGQIEDRCILQELQIEKENGWIPCSERLPEDSQSVIFSTKDGLVESGWYDAKKNWCVNESYFPGAFYFIAWQPLPEPYKEKENV